MVTATPTLELPVVLHLAQMAGLMGLLLTVPLSAQCSPKTVINSTYQIAGQQVSIEVMVRRDIQPYLQPSFEPGSTSGVGLALTAFSGSRAVSIRQGWTLKRGWITHQDSTWALIPQADAWWSSDSSFFSVYASSTAGPPTGSLARVIVELQTSSAVECVDLGTRSIVLTM